MRKIYKLFVALLVIMLCLSSCSKYTKDTKYTEDDIIGLTSSEIIEKYGDFDRKRGTPDEDGLYRDCACGYLISEKETDFFGTTPPEYFMIYFDENGVADWCNYEKVV